MNHEEIMGEIQRRLSPETRKTIRNIDWFMLGLIPAIECADGFRFSMQASWFHRCRPRNNGGPWTHVEVGFPSKREEQLMPYINEWGADPIKTVYDFVPVETVADVILDHGGFAIESGD